MIIAPILFYILQRLDAPVWCFVLLWIFVILGLISYTSKLIKLILEARQ